MVGAATEGLGGGTGETWLVVHKSEMESLALQFSFSADVNRLKLELFPNFVVVFDTGNRSGG